MTTAYLIKPFAGLMAALRAKDEPLLIKLDQLPPHLFVDEWKKVHPGDFPQGGMSLVDASSVKLN